MSAQTLANISDDRSTHHARARLLMLACCVAAPLSSASATDLGVCYLPEKRELKRLAPVKDYNFKWGRRPGYKIPHAWEHEFKAHAEAIVARLNAETSSAPTSLRATYDLYVTPSWSMLRIAGKLYAAVTVCAEGSATECRGRSFWAPNGTSPQALAELAIERTIADRPGLRQCKLRDPAAPLSR